MRRVVIELRRWFLLLLMAAVGCQTLGFLEPTPSQSPATLPTPINAADTTTPTAIQLQLTSVVVGPLPSDTPAPPSPTVPPIILTPTVIPFTSTSTRSPTLETIACRVGNTDGDGVFIRRTPRMEDRVKAWPDQTEMIVVGPDLRSDERIWKSVQDPEGNVGYVPVEYVICPERTVEPETSATPRPAPTSPTATVTLTESPTKRPTSTLTLTPVQAQVACPNSVPWNEAKLHIGEQLTVIGRVVATRYSPANPGAPTVLDVGQPSPDPDRLTVLIRESNRSSFRSPPEHEYIGKTVCVTGLISSENGIARTEASSPAAIVIVQSENEE